MELQTITIEQQNIVPSGVKIEKIMLRRSGIAKVIWRQLNTIVPPSTIIENGVNIYKG